MTHADLVQAPLLRHWVIGDVHGCHASLLALLAVLPCNDHLVFCGDVVSRSGRIEASMHMVWEDWWLDLTSLVHDKRSDFKFTQPGTSGSGNQFYFRDRVVRNQAQDP